MSRICIPFATGDISTLARSLRDQMNGNGRVPSHLELLNMLARAAGYRNYQSFRAQNAASGHVEPPPAPEPVDMALIQRAAHCFDAQGRLARWPGKPGIQELCLWGLWSRLPARKALSEEELNRHLRAGHLFGDHALLRRELCDRQLVARTPDGRQYLRIERRPSAGALSLVRQLAANGRPQ